jgi:hypothetical protein
MVGRKSHCGDLLPVKEIKDGDISTQFNKEYLNNLSDSDSDTDTTKEDENVKP